jgi:hypothetical protein
MTISGSNRHETFATVRCSIVRSMATPPGSPRAYDAG